MEQYEAWKALLRAGEATGWQEFYVKFYQAFIDGSRWKQYFNGVGTTLMVTAMALTIGILLGVLVAMVRTAHDQQRTGKHNPVLGVLNGICQVYTTVIRGTPMMVQLLIMGFVIFSSSRNYTMVGALTLGINSGAYVSEIIRGGLMALDPGQAEAGRSLGLNYIDTMRFIVIPQAFKAILPALGNEFITLLKDDLGGLLQLETRLSNLEQAVLTDQSGRFLHQMSVIRKELNRANRFYAQLGDFASSLQEYAGDLFDTFSAKRFDAFLRKADALREETRMLREYASQISSEYQAQVDIQQNRVMKLLTIVTTIFLPLSLLVGWYGMNFQGMPELSWTYGYPAVIAVSVLLAVGLIVYFKRKHWF